MESLDILFIDLEVATNTSKIYTIGALYKAEKYKGVSISAIRDIYFKYKPEYICGHNFINHDKRFLVETSFNPIFDKAEIIDTFFVSMLLYPDKLSHKLSKPYKTEAHIQNDPFGDCVATQNLLELMIDRFNSFAPPIKTLLASLLSKNGYFKGFFSYVGVELEKVDVYNLFKDQIKCSKERFEQQLNEYPSEMAIILVYLKTNERTSLSYAVLQIFPNIVRLLKELKYNPSSINLEQFADDEFGIKGFREFEPRDKGTDLFNLDAEKISQLDIIKATLNDESLLAILPTGGGKTFTFQMPALIKAGAYKALTIVISPLQALMKNHVDSFSEKNQNYKVVAISGYLSPIERLNAIAEVENGIIDILYLAPEALRSNSIFNALKKRIIERFVIDEAHCFSSWGHDFRHDYKYIATFIKDLQDASPFQGNIPVSCLTATAKPEVLEDIKRYFDDRLELKLSDYLASSKRTNLHYTAIEVFDDKEKYETLINEIIRIGRKPTIIYIPQNARMCRELSEKMLQDLRLTALNFVIEPFYSMIDSEIEDGKRRGRNKSEILNDFIDDKINIVIATTAFGMGIDKPNIQAVIHYETSDSLESYLQESGRGGRSDDIEAECIVLYANSDFDKLFNRQNRSKIEYGEINRILKEIKKEKRNPVILSTKQIAEKAGIDTEDSSKDYDVMIKTALLELEEAGIIRRGRNTTKIYATSINKEGNSSTMEYVHNVLDPHKAILDLYDQMIRVMATIIGRSKLDPIEVDDLADNTGVNRSDVHKVLYKLAEFDLIAMENDISAFISGAVIKELESHFEIENKLIEFLKALPDYQNEFHLRDVNDTRLEKTNYIGLSRKIIQSFTHLSSLANKKFKVKFKKEICRILEKTDLIKVIELVKIRQSVARSVVDTLLEKQKNSSDEEVEFSSTELQQSVNVVSKISTEGFHHTLVYLHDTLKEFKLRRGRLIYYQAFALQKDNRIEEALPYQKRRDYNQSLKLYYERKTEAIHILRAFYKKLSEEQTKYCEKFISDYFSMDYNAFKKDYKFNEKLIKLPLTEDRYRQIVEDLNEEQSRVFEDKTNRAVMVLAGPGSGKTKTLVHKIASLITLENHKPEHFIMLTHGRAAATEFRDRLAKLIGGLAYEVDIMTFHAYALQLIGKRANDQNRLDQVIELATHGIKLGEIEIPYKTMLILDEYQDVSQKIYDFIKTLFNRMETDKRIIAVGDDDQCINNFNGNDRAEIRLMRTFENEFNYGVSVEEEDENSGNFARYSLLNNYRSKSNIVTFANEFARTIPDRLKCDDLIANDSTNGYIEIFNYPLNTSMIQNIADLVEKDSSENIAILCKTNQAVLTMYSILKAKGINVKYLTAKDGFRLGQLVELQDFLEMWKKSSFDEAFMWVNERYKKSTNLSLTQKVIERFGNEANFKSGSSEFLTTEFEKYLYDIEFEEFESTKAKVIVSTMHKAKGKEFDSVYLMVENNFIQDDYQRRLLYVAITRAKDNLHIHTQDRCFKMFESFANDVHMINMNHEEPNSIVLTMGLGDLSLSNKDAAVGISETNPVAGEIISIEMQRFNEGTVRFKLSKNGQTIGVLSKPDGGKDRLSAKILDKEKDGYILDFNAEIEYVVDRQDPITKESHLQVLSNITMHRRSHPIS
ncbi:MAG: RecQ family ATP-dependent DNA helicase [Methylotenera sp.]|nr:RecQ family ATP-dependent DNA helicase [Methylotenera sp.]MDP2404293.1 RecQ family ATP-dependent DNA helicase [Methylotenera sp.]MDP3095956.1 RecQ family ATP-dependent DNA helicase [Methylotenera sp.]MDZ4223640.1 RecQ family ATP-dependent DNA helicase [Methylotenera sp.]